MFRALVRAWTGHLHQDDDLAGVLAAGGFATGCATPAGGLVLVGFKPGRGGLLPGDRVPHAGTVAAGRPRTGGLGPAADAGPTRLNHERGARLWERSNVHVDPVAYTIDQAAAAVGMSRQTIKRAIQATDPRTFPPPLRAKRAGTSPKAKYLIATKTSPRGSTHSPRREGLDNARKRPTSGGGGPLAASVRAGQQASMRRPSRSTCPPTAGRLFM